MAYSSVIKFRCQNTAYKNTAYKNTVRILSFCELPTASSSVFHMLTRSVTNAAPRRHVVMPTKNGRKQLILKILSHTQGSLRKGLFYSSFLGILLYVRTIKHKCRNTTKWNALTSHKTQH